MAFDLEHDWEGNLATPRARIGERAKTRLLILLCAIWICLGLVSHTPWKPDESQSISIVKSMLHGESLVAPVVAGQTVIENPPLYYLSAAGMAQLLSPPLPMHDAARVVTGIWMALTLLMVGMTGREIWGLGAGRQTAFIFLSSIGLVVTAHMLMPEVAALTGSAMSLYALALAARRPYRASVLLGSGIGISFLSTGLQAALIPTVTAAVLPLLFRNWRTKSYAVVLGLGAAAAAPWLIVWPVMCWYLDPQLFSSWWHNSLAAFNHANYGYFINVLAWYAWPALPIALWGVWRYRTELLREAKFQPLIVFFVVCILLLGAGSDTREIYALPLLLPLAALSGGAIETLKRGAAGALQWFGILMFGIIGFLIWLGWFAMLTGWPPKLTERMQFLSATMEAHFSWLTFLSAAAITVVWLIVVINAKHSNRAAVTNWAVGITMAWSLLMTLWLPWIDSAKSYETLMLSLKRAIPQDYACITSRNLGKAQQALLDYYTGLRTQPFEKVQHMGCDLYLIQDERGREKIEPGPDWQLIWQGRRPSDRREFFRLYQAKR
ncbi:MAG TPA: glycosyl transferase [Methylophilaceae bacterium]|nr:glycosyl transferase [Methylophilaceae bacterium]